MSTKQPLRRLGESLMWRLFPCANLRFTLKSGLVVPVGTKSEMATFRELFVRQDYDDLLALVPAARTVLDLGCNCGYFPLLMHHRARLAAVDMANASFVLVDANPAMVERAQAVVETNRLPGTFAFHTGLVGPRDGEMEFHITKESASSSALHRPAKSRSIRLRALDLGRLLQEHFPDGLDLIKCDIEGGEMMLASAWPESLRRTKAFLVEWHDFAGPWAAFQSSVEAAGFKLAGEQAPNPKFKTALFLRVP